MLLPPPNGLLALEAVIRLDSVSKAAEELGISQPAVSQRLRSLERFFGRRLIERGSTGFTAGPDVRLFAARLRGGIAEIRDASAVFRDQSRRVENQLTIALLATFAQRWLIPRLIGFQQKYPDIDVRLMTTSRPIDLVREDVDLSIRCGDGTWRGMDSELVMENRIFPVASPTFLESHPLHAIGDLRGAVLIRVEAPPRDHDWDHWLRTAGAIGLEPRAWQTYANSTHALEAATAGLGVAMAHTPFVADSIAAGRLIKPFELEGADGDGDYHLVSRVRREPPRRIRLFRDWLLGDASSPAG